MNGCGQWVWLSFTIYMYNYVDNTERETENQKAFDHFKKQQVVGKTSKPIASTPTERDGK